MIIIVYHYAKIPIDFGISKIRIQISYTMSNTLPLELTETYNKNHILIHLKKMTIM